MVGFRCSGWRRAAIMSRAWRGEEERERFMSVSGIPVTLAPGASGSQSSMRSKRLTWESEPAVTNARQQVRNVRFGELDAPVLAVHPDQASERRLHRPGVVRAQALERDVVRVEVRSRLQAIRK